MLSTKFSVGVVGAYAVFCMPALAVTALQQAAEQVATQPLREVASASQSIGVAPMPELDTVPVAEPKFVAFKQDPFSSLVSGKRRRKKRTDSESGVERYVVASANRVFLFENLGTEARLRFLCGPDDPRIDCLIDDEVPAEEVHVLTPTRASRGDTIYRDPRGEILLRIASYGGATVYWPGEARGLAASKSYGDDPSLKLSIADQDSVSRRLSNATALLSARIGAPVTFQADQLLEDEVSMAAVLSDAISRAANGLARVAEDSTGARVIASRVTSVKFVPGDGAGLMLDGKTFVVQYDPYRGIKGRPSSAKILEFLENEL